MAFTAKAVTAATASWPLVLSGRPYAVRPVSAALVLRVLPALRVPETADAALTELLRAALGNRRWFRDPVTAAKALPVGLLARTLDRILAVPGHEVDESVDPEAALIAAHRKMAHPVESSLGPSLALAALTCEVRMGAGWYYNPDRWPTSDGYAPMACVWTTYGGLMALDAGAQLATTNAVRIANSTDKGVDRVIKTLQKAAYPPDPTMRGAA